MKRFLVAVLFLLVCFSLFGEDISFVGTWKMINIAVAGGATGRWIQFEDDKDLRGFYKMRFLDEDILILYGRYRRDLRIGNADVKMKGFYEVREDEFALRNETKLTITYTTTEDKYRIYITKYNERFYFYYFFASYVFIGEMVKVEE